MVDWQSRFLRVGKQLNEFVPRLWAEIKNLVPLFRYLILQTETHAFCLALACAVLIGFFPSCLVMLSITKNVLHWDSAVDVILEMVRGYFLPIPGRTGRSDQTFVTDNLVAVLANYRNGIGWASVFWVLLGAAAVFVPLESALNRLWDVKEDRPYWKNQVVGLALTSLCAALGLLFVSVATALHWLLIFDFLRSIATFIVGICFFTFSIFSLYKLLPNKKVETSAVLPASVLAGVLVQIVRLIYFKVAPDLSATQGPFSTSVTFLVLIYIESFVVLGCAYLASRKDRYPWIEFISMKDEETSRDLPP